MSTLEEKYTETGIDGKRWDRSIDYTAARNSLGNDTRMMLTLFGPLNQMEQRYMGLKRTLKRLTVDYNPVDGKCKLTDDSLYEGGTDKLDIPWDTATVYDARIVSNVGVEVCRSGINNRLFVENGKRLNLCFSNRIIYSFDQDSNEILIHDQATGGAMVPLLISVVNAKTANAFFIKNDQAKPVVVKHEDMDSILTADYSTVNTGITISGNSVGDINIQGKFQSACSAFTAYLDADKVLLFRISDNAKVRNFQIGTEINFWLSSLGTTEQ